MSKFLQSLTSLFGTFKNIRFVCYTTYQINVLLSILKVYINVLSALKMFEKHDLKYENNELTHVSYSKFLRQKVLFFKMLLFK